MKLIMAAVLALGSPTGPAAASTGQILEAAGAQAIPGSYIVVIKGDADKVNLARIYGGTIDRVFGKALNGFEVRMPEPSAPPRRRSGRRLRPAQRDFEHRRRSV